MSVSKGLANNMSCSVCCACPSSQSVSLAPSSWTESVGSTFSFSPTESSWSNCGTQTYPLSASSLAPWISDNASVSVNQSTGVISCQAGGSATVSGDIFLTSTDIDYKNIPIEACPNCISTSTEQNPSAPVTAATFTGVLTANDNFSGRSTTNFGIAGVINLSFSTNPTGTPATSFGGLRWTLVSGGGTLSNAGTAGTATYTAPSSPATVVLRLADGQGNGSNYPITVIAPSGGHLVKNSNLRHTNGYAGVGFRGDAFLEPANVSFAGIFFSEGTAFAVASGFYAQFNGKQHPDGFLISVGSCNSTTGCKVSTQDTVDTGDLGPPFSVGDFLWPIPWQYSVGTGSQTQFTMANQHHFADATGKASAEKAGAGPFSKNASDPTSSF